MKRLLKKTNNVKNKKFAQANSTAGFTLIETMVAVGILAVSVTTLIIATSQGIFNLSRTKARITSNYLAQEGVELMRNARDTKLLNGESFEDNIFYSTCSSDGGCSVSRSPDLGSLSSSLCDVGEACLNLWMNEYGDYQAIQVNSDDIETPYSRKILIEKMSHIENNRFYYKITSTVSYNLGSGDKQVEYVTYLTEWVNTF